MIRKNQPRSPAPRRGAHTVEFAIVAPVMFLFILGIIELARGLMVIHLLNNAARVGARLGTIEGTSTDQITAAVTSSLKSANITGESVSVLVNEANVNASGATVGQDIRVLITVPVSSVSWVPVPQFLTGNLSGQYALPRE